MISVRTWLVVDAVLDNVAAVALQSDGDDDVIARANALRKRGWDAAAAHPQRGRGPVGWPPSDTALEIELHDADLQFVSDRVDAAVVVATHLVSADDLTTLRDARAELRDITTVA
ncbi:hypothetical protein [Microbacterium sp. A1-JK]|uniref:hypothetical protein n=1 Tax=Microbacterium sp. A1-JK TaxID=3177516 RepID=UPI00388A40B4